MILPHGGTLVSRVLPPNERKKALAQVPNCP